MGNAKLKSLVRYCILIGCLLCLTVLMFAGYRYWHRNHNPRLDQPLTAAERDMLGLWRLHSSGPKRAGVGEIAYALLSDHTCHKHFYDSQTGQLTFVNTNHVWWRDGDDLTISNLSGAGDTFLRVWDRHLPADYIHALTPDGSGRYAYRISVDIEALNIPKTQTNETGVMEKENIIE